MTEVAVTILPAAALHVFEIWSAPKAVALRFEAVTGFALPARGRSAGDDVRRLIRYEPTVWLVDGTSDGLPAILADDGALTAVGGGTVRLRISGTGWRALLMEGGVFDAENPRFGPGCSATTLIDRVNVRLHVIGDHTCDVYVQRSFGVDLFDFWQKHKDF